MISCKPGGYAALVWSVVLFASVGCSTTQPTGFALDAKSAEQRLVELRKNPVPLDRPVVILDGFLDPGFGSLSYRNELTQVTGDERVLRVTYVTASSIAECAERALDEIDAAFPGEAVDVIGISMGGVVAFHVADAGRVEVARIFTLSSPLRGARMANLPTWLGLQRDLRPDSDATAALPGMIERFAGTRVHYAGVTDQTVRVDEAAPPGETAHVLPNNGMARWGHTGVIRDPRVRLDIFLRLRNQPPITPTTLPR
ncbi:MAG: hypothetical protein AAF743_05080 [Planctomycetota bacterium]